MDLTQEVNWGSRFFILCLLGLLSWEGPEMKPAGLHPDALPTDIALFSVLPALYMRPGKLLLLLQNLPISRSEVIHFYGHHFGIALSGISHIFSMVTTPLLSC